jgi:hypothetical protein
MLYLKWNSSWIYAVLMYTFVKDPGWRWYVPLLSLELTAYADTAD